MRSFDERCGGDLRCCGAPWPFVAVFATGGATRWVNLALVALLIAFQVVSLHGGSLRKWVALLLPVGVLLVIWAYLRAVLLTHACGGIRWRGTFCSLQELRGARAPPPPESRDRRPAGKAPCRGQPGQQHNLDNPSRNRMRASP